MTADLSHDELRDRIREHLQPGEKVLWIGQPDPKLFRGESAGMFVFGFIPMTAGLGALSLAILGVGRLEAIFPGLIGLFFCAIGLYALSAPWRVPRRLKKTIYALTDRAAIVLNGVGCHYDGRYSGQTEFDLHEQSYVFGPESLRYRSRKRRARRRADLVFGEEVHHGRKGRERIVEIGFLGLADPDEVDRLIDEQFPRPAKKEMESGVVTGSLPRRSLGDFARNAIGYTIALGFLTAMFLAGGWLFFGGIRQAGKIPGFAEELWIWLFFGVLLMIFACSLGYFLFWHRRRREIFSFKFDGEVLTYRTRTGAKHSVTSTELQSITERRAVDDRADPGWWLRFQGKKRVVLSAKITNASELVSRLL